MRLFVFTALAISINISAVQAQSVDAPIFAVGDRWEFEEIDMASSKLKLKSSYKVIETDGDYLRLSGEIQQVDLEGKMGKLQTSEVTKRADLNSSTTYRGEKKDTILYKWPLQPGKTWTNEISRKLPLPVSATSTVLTTVTAILNAEVEEWETIQVPAGKFKTLKIIHRNKVVFENSPDSINSVVTFWYSPSVKSDVLSFSDEFNAKGELLKRTKRELIRYQVK
jgi:hypothetical protein